MKKKALLKTIADILKIVMGILGYGAFICIGEYLFFMLPGWVLSGLGLFEKYGHYNAGFIYLIELLIIIGIIFVVWIIRKLYLDNLQDIENTEQTKYFKQLLDDTKD